LGGRHIYFRYNATSDDIVDNTIEQVDLENMDTVVEILSVGVLELEITLGVFYLATHQHNVCAQYISNTRVNLAIKQAANVFDFHTIKWDECWIVIGRRVC